MKKINVEFGEGIDVLRGKMFIPKGKGPFPAIISFHGNGGRGEKYFEWGEKFAKQGFLAFAFNFRGCGISDGNYLIQTHKDALLDAKGAFDFLISQTNVDGKRIGVIGGSFGGFIAAMLIPKYNIKSLVLMAPSSCMHKLLVKLDEGGLEKEVKYFKEEKNWFNSLAYKNISEFSKQLLIIKSEYDENIPTEVVDRYLDQAFNAEEKQMKVISGADHRLSKQWMRNEAFEIMSDWFLKTL